MGLKDYTDTKNGPQLAVLKHAVIGDRIGEVKIEKGFLKFKGTMTDKHTKEVHHCTMAGCDCDFPELFVGQFIFRRRVQRDMEYRIGRPAVGFEVRPETLHAGVDIHSSVFVEGLQHLLPIEDFGFIPVYFLLVVV